MTGYGESQCQENGLRIFVQVRTVNSRYFKLALRCPDGYGALEPQVETLVRQLIKRGTVQINLRVDKKRRPEDYRLDVDVLEGYHRQLARLCRQLHEMEEISVASLLTLPGVIVEQPEECPDAQQIWPLVEKALGEALAALRQMREDEGRMMAADMLENCRSVEVQLDQIKKRAPTVAGNYRDRLTERVQAALAELDVTMSPADVLREVAIFAERSDVSEEVVRMRSHIEQFISSLDVEESSGRKLEFLTQEMFREANTIGSKANDVEIAERVIDIKASIERLREMVQNVE